MLESCQGLFFASLIPNEVTFPVAILLLIVLIYWLWRQNRSQGQAVDSLEKARIEVKKMLERANGEAEQQRQNALQEAEVILKEAKVKAKEEVLAAKEEFEATVRQRRKELQRSEERLTAKEENVDKKQELLDQRHAEIDRREEELKRQSAGLKTKEQEIDARLQQQISELEHIAGMSRDDARSLLLERLEESLEEERGILIHRYQEENRQRLSQEAQTIMVSAMQRYVGVKMAARNRPPEQRLSSMKSTREKPSCQKISVSRETVPMKDTGMRQEMTLRTIRYSPPISSASALISPMAPGRMPRIMDWSV